MDSIIQAQGIHHITLNGADKKTSIDFWQNILGMKFIFEQPNLDDLNTNHLYFDCGDGTTVTVFTNENLKPDKNKLKNQDNISLKKTQDNQKSKDDNLLEKDRSVPEQKID